MGEPPIINDHGEAAQARECKRMAEDLLELANEVCPPGSPWFAIVPRDPERTMTRERWKALHRHCRVITRIVHAEMPSPPMDRIARAVVFGGPNLFGGAAVSQTPEGKKLFDEAAALLYPTPEERE